MGGIGPKLTEIGMVFRLHRTRTERGSELWNFGPIKEIGYHRLLWVTMGDQAVTEGAKREARGGKRTAPGAMRENDGLRGGGRSIYPSTAIEIRGVLHQNVIFLTHFW